VAGQALPRLPFRDREELCVAGQALPRLPFRDREELCVAGQALPRLPFRDREELCVAGQALPRLPFRDREELCVAGQALPRLPLYGRTGTMLSLRITNERALCHSERSAPDGNSGRRQKCVARAAKNLSVGPRRGSEMLRSAGQRHTTSEAGVCLAGSAQHDTDASGTLVRLPSSLQPVQPYLSAPKGRDAEGLCGGERPCLCSWAAMPQGAATSGGIQRGTAQYRRHQIRAAEKPASRTHTTKKGDA
jgi:hypothetical protein